MLYFWIKRFTFEPTMGFEPMTSSLPRKRSTPELRRHCFERKTGLEPATYSLEGCRSTGWATSAKTSGGGRIRTSEGESQQIYSLPHLTALEPPQLIMKMLFYEPMEGFEPPTVWLQIRCSGQLSYIGKCFIIIFCLINMQRTLKKQTF